jgi:hypothetical protein
MVLSGSGQRVGWQLQALTALIEQVPRALGERSISEPAVERRDRQPGDLLALNRAEVDPHLPRDRLHPSQPARIRIRRGPLVEAVQQRAVDLDRQAREPLFLDDDAFAQLVRRGQVHAFRRLG